MTRAELCGLVRCILRLQGSLAPLPFITHHSSMIRCEGWCHFTHLRSPPSTPVFVSPCMPSSEQSGLWTNRALFAMEPFSGAAERSIRALQTTSRRQSALSSCLDPDWCDPHNNTDRAGWKWTQLPKRCISNTLPRGQWHYIMLFSNNLFKNKLKLQFIYVTLDHKTSHKGQFFEIEIYTSSESWINKHWCMVC